jgi:hypothetical protein
LRLEHGNPLRVQDLAQPSKTSQFAHTFRSPAFILPRLTNHGPMVAAVKTLPFGWPQIVEKLVFEHSQD